MPIERLGTLQRVDPSTLWNHEAHDFTPWLLENEEESSLEKDQCSSCGQPIPEDLRLKQQNLIHETKATIADLDSAADQERHDALGTTIKRMREIAPAGVAEAMVVVEQDLTANSIESHKAKRKVEDAESDLRGFDKKVVPEFAKLSGIASRSFSGK